MGASHQLPLPGIGQKYPSVPHWRAKGATRYRVHLVYLACRELRGEGGGVAERKQEAVRDRTAEIHRRHFPVERGFDGVSERTIRRNKLMRRMCRRLRDLPVALLRPADPSLAKADPAVLLDRIARMEDALAATEADKGRLVERLGICEAEKLQLTAQVASLLADARASVPGGGD